MAETEFYKARTSFATIINDVPVVVKQDELVRKGDPLLKDGRDKLFDPYEPESRFDAMTSRRGVEQATAAPGEKRRR